MIVNPQETKKQLLTLFENELSQEQMDAMVLAIQQRIVAHQGESLSAKQVNHIICAVYREQTQALRKSSLPALRHLSQLLCQRRWEEPGVIEFKKKE